MIMDDELYKLDCKIFHAWQARCHQVLVPEAPRKEFFSLKAFDERLPMPHDSANSFLDLVA